LYNILHKTFSLQSIAETFDEILAQVLRREKETFLASCIRLWRWHSCSC